MKSIKKENLGGGLKRETKTYDSGAKKITTYKEGLIFRNVKSSESVSAPKRRG